MLHIKHLALTNLGGLENFESDVPEVAVVVGDNGNGKSSVLNMIATIFQGGSSTDLLYNGAAKGVGTLSLSDDYSMTKVIEPNKYTLSVIDPNGGKITSGAATIVNEIVPKGTFDARNLFNDIKNEPEKVKQFLLSNLPLSFSKEEVNKALGPQVQQVVTPTLTLAELNAVADARFEDRTQLGRDKRNLEGALATQESDLKSSDSEDWNKKHTQAQKVESEIRAEIQQARGTAEVGLNQRIAEEKARVAAAIKKLQEEYHAWETKTRTEVQKVLDEELVELNDRLQRAVADVSIAATKAEDQTKAAGRREAVLKLKETLKGYVLKETNLTAAIENLAKLKKTKLREIPIAGLDIREDKKGNIQITIEEIPLSSLNTQQLLYVCVNFIAEAQKAKGAKLRLMIVDGSAFTEPYLIQLAEACQRAKIQLIVEYAIKKAPLQILSLEQFREKYAGAEEEEQEEVEA